MKQQQEEKKCPNCGQYKLVTNKERARILAGISFVIMGICIFFIITILIAPIPLLVSIGAFIYSFYAKGAECTNCHYKIDVVGKK